jgi:hypothetical protein
MLQHSSPPYRRLRKWLCRLLEKFHHRFLNIQLSSKFLPASHFLPASNSASFRSLPASNHCQLQILASFKFLCQLQIIARSLPASNHCHLQILASFQFLPASHFSASFRFLPASNVYHFQLRTSLKCLAASNLPASNLPT